MFQEVHEKQKTSEWFDIGLIKGTSYTVQYYYLPGDENIDLSQALTTDYFKNRTKVNLEPGQAYRFRVAAVNSCGQSSWSEVSDIYYFLQKLILID